MSLIRTFVPLQVLSERDELIRNKLSSATSDNSELLQIESEIESGISGARSKGEYFTNCSSHS